MYLYGSIMGLKRREIHEKFDEIVAFAELEQFIDTPLNITLRGCMRGSALPWPSTWTLKYC